VILYYLFTQQLQIMNLFLLIHPDIHKKNDELHETVAKKGSFKQVKVHCPAVEHQSIKAEDLSSMGKIEYS